MEKVSKIETRKEKMITGRAKWGKRSMEGNRDVCERGHGGENRGVKEMHTKGRKLTLVEGDFNARTG